MRNLSIILGCVLALSASAAANPPEQTTRIQFHFARPDTARATFQDEVVCSRSAVKAVFSHQIAAGGGQYIQYIRSAPDFMRCMAEKGYRLDNHGYGTGRMRFAT